MTNSTRFLCFCFSLFLVAAGTSFDRTAARADEPTGLRCGVAVSEITPPVPYRLAGYFNERFSTGTHDPLLSKAIVLTQNDVKVALLICDVISVPDYVTTPLRTRVAEASDIPVSNILITATHTHTGPLYYGKSRDYLHQRAIDRDGKDAAETLDYQQYLVEKGSETILAANRSLRPATIETTETTTEKITFNRRFLMKDGTVVFNPGVKNPEIVRPAGPTDPELQTIFFVDPESQKPFASLTNFALHLDTTGGTLNSGDYPFYLARRMKERFGDDFLSVFGTGTCGDLNHIDVSGEKKQNAETVGNELADIVLGLVDAKQLTPETPNLAAAEAKSLWKRQVYGKDETDEAKKNMEVVVGEGDFPLTLRARYSAMVELDALPESIPLNVQVVRLSDETAIVAIPGEVFVEFGLAIKERSPFKNTLVIELAQAAIDYVPTKKAFEEGSYETINSVIAPGGGEQIVEVAVKALNEL